MVFSSIEFLWFFMPAVLALYALVPPRWRNALLASVSLVFYVWGAEAILFLLLASILFNYVAGRLIGSRLDAGREDSARKIMWAAIVANLLVLFGWKYTLFAVDQVNDVIGLFGDARIDKPSIVLPIGISFFTFHAISYVVDVTRGDARPTRSISDYAQYMAFFPQLIAGPIIRYKQIDDQIRNPPPRSRRLEDIAEGFPRFALGLSKKVLIADQVAPIADAAFGDPGGLDHGRGVDRRAGLHGADLLRLLRLQRHGDRAGADVRLQVPGELRPPLLVRLPDRLLAALAHHPVALVPGLRVHPAGRIARVPGDRPHATC